MSLLSRGSRAAARSFRQPIAYQSRRSASGHSDDHHGHGSDESAFHVKGGSTTGSESFGTGFYVSLAAIPVAYLTYILSTSDDNFINKAYQNYRKQLKAQDVLHSAALEQAISDRATKHSSNQAVKQAIKPNNEVSSNQVIKQSSNQDLTPGRLGGRNHFKSLFFSGQVVGSYFFFGYESCHDFSSILPRPNACAITIDRVPLLLMSNGVVRACRSASVVDLHLLCGVFG